jgi:hypothetical protein
VGEIAEGVRFVVREMLDGAAYFGGAVISPDIE